MGRERQKRKNRSSIPKVRQRTKSKKQIFHNPIIAANWDKTQTLSQNYKRLGLAVKLNKQSGGVEKDLAKLEQREDGTAVETARPDSLTIASAPAQGTLGLEEIRVERDPTTGRIINVIQPEGQLNKPNPLNDPLNELDSGAEDTNSTWARLDNQHGNTDAQRVSSKQHATTTDVVAQLEQRASMPAARHNRPQTENEQAFVQALVEKHGNDFNAMARDMKINYMQRSAGDLKRRVKKWKENGGQAG